MKKRSTWLLAICVVATACKNGYNPEIMSSINAALDEANTITTTTNKQIYRRMDDKRRNYRGRAKGEIWAAEALRIKELSANVCRYIDSLKLQLVSVKENDNSGIRNLVINNGHRLYQVLTAYQQDILKIDVKEFANNPFRMAWWEKDLKSLSKTINKSMDAVSDSTEAPLSKEDAWMTSHFSNTPQPLAFAVLNKLKNDVLFSERTMIEYFNNIFSDGFCGYYNSIPIATLGSAYVKAGERMELTVGVGYFSFDDAYPHFTINDSDVLADQSNMAVYKLRANGTPGKHSIPVVIEYYTSLNKTDTFTKQLEYTISQ